MKILLAPLQGMTNAFYRNTFDALFGGIDIYYAPFVSSSSVRKVGASIFKDLLPENNTAQHVIPQILGNNGENFRHYAKRITDLGYNEINWNIGCPFPTVTKKKKGSGILPYPKMVTSLLDEVCKDPYDLTIKMRLGLEDQEEGLKLIQLFNDYPIKSIIIHGRTGDQRYEGVVDLDGFDNLYQASNHEVIYNGDIFTYEDFKMIENRYPNIEQFMIGRGALRDPFLPSIIKNKGQNSFNRQEKTIELHDYVFNQYQAILSGERHILDKMKEFWFYLSYNYDHDGKFMKKMKKCSSLDQYRVLAYTFLNTKNLWL